MKGEYYVDSNGNECFDTEKMEKEEFERVMAEHRLWLSDHEKGKRAYLRDTDLSEMDLSGMDFSYADMCGINLFRSNLTGTNLSHADLKQGFLHDADLTGAIVEKADFFGANLTMAKLDKCAGSEARFAFSRMWGCQIKSAELKKAFYFGAQVCDCDFSGSDLEAANFSTADLDNSVFVDTNLKDADFFDVGAEEALENSVSETTSASTNQEDFVFENGHNMLIVNILYALNNYRLKYLGSGSIPYCLQSSFP